MVRGEGKGGQVMRETKTDRIQIKIEPSIKAQAQELATKDGRTLSNWIIQLMVKEIERAK